MLYGEEELTEKEEENKDKFPNPSPEPNYPDPLLNPTEYEQFSDAVSRSHGHPPCNHWR